MAIPPDHRPSGEPGIAVISATLLCIVFLFSVLAFAEPKIEPQPWPRAGQWECTR
jgi:hypothetical protein